VLLHAVVALHHAMPAHHSHDHDHGLPWMLDGGMHGMGRGMHGMAMAGMHHGF
jgi:hypothetical protein